MAFAGCSGSKSISSSDDRASFTPLFVPAGVDSTIAREADSLALASFVSITDQEAASIESEEGATLTAFSDSLWRYLEMTQDSTGSVGPELAQAALRSANQAVQPLNELIQLQQATDLDSATVVRRQAALLDQAQQALEEAIRLNPFDLQTQSVLARVYTAQAQRLGQANAYQQSIDVLEKLTRLRPDQHTLFIALANNYYQTQQWDAAVLNYERAEQVYLNTYDLVADQVPAGPDNQLLYEYATRLADVHVIRRDANAAISAYERALGVAPNDEERAFVRGEMDWINWDNGNVSASFTRDSLVNLVQEQRFDEAEHGFLELLRSIQSPRAVDETEWRLATVQYQQGKGDEAADRLLRLIRRIPVEPGTGVPSDSTNQRYFDTFGTICFNQAMFYLGEQRDNRTALKYLEQAAQFPWKDRARAYLESAKLLRSNTKEAKKRAHFALNEIDTLSPEDQKELFGLLATFYRTEGDFDQARVYLEKYRNL